jgi:PIN domain nuclease of toxin-antitoxin system
LTGLPDAPADRFIAATAIVHNATLMTADDRLLGWPHTLARQNASQ